jgi:hypothetical protein
MPFPVEEVTLFKKKAPPKDYFIKEKTPPKAWAFGGVL